LSNQNLFSYEIFNNTQFFNTSLIENSVLFNNAKTLANDIEILSTIKADIEGLFDIFPEYATFIERFEFHSLEDDGSLVEALSTPDVKLNYPEPFIASPSFVHEEL
jgi:hypothetical protein